MIERTLVDKGTRLLIRVIKAPDFTRILVDDPRIVAHGTHDPGAQLVALVSPFST